MNLLLMRHAKSDWEQGVSDFDRPLNTRGLFAAEQMGILLADKNLMPDFIICSGAQRARQTAECVIEGLRYEGQLFVSNHLYLCDIGDFIRVIGKNGADHDTLLVIAHNPGTEGFITHLTDEQKHVTTANIAHIKLPITEWSEIKSSTKGDLIDFWRPREPR